MSFRIDREVFEGEHLVRISNEDTKEYFEVLPSLGGTVKQISLLKDNHSLYSILREDGKGESATNPLFRGRVLFPFNDRIPGGKYQFEGNEYQLPINCEEDQSSIHGLLYNRAMKEGGFELTEQDGSVTLIHQFKESDFKGYPFSVKISITYKLNVSSFSMEFKIDNTGSKGCPIALGWHPYFLCPGQLSGWEFEYSGNSYVEVGHDLLPTGNQIAVEGSHFDFRKPKKLNDLALDIALECSNDGEMSLESDQYKLKLDYDKDLFKYTQLYIPDERDSIAIEPVSAATNAFNQEGLGLITLVPQETKLGAICVRL